VSGRGPVHNLYVNVSRQLFAHMCSLLMSVSLFTGKSLSAPIPAFDVTANASVSLTFILFFSPLHSFSGTSEAWTGSCRLQLAACSYCDCPAFDFIRLSLFLRSTRNCPEPV